MTTKPKITLKLKPVKEGTGTSRLVPTQDDFTLLDLRKDAGIGDDTDKSVKLNQHILTMLNDLIEITIKQKSTADSKDRIAYGHKITSFTKGRDAINGYTKEITSGAQARKEIPGVGEGIAKRIDEFMLTGKLKDLELQQHTNPEANIIMELTKVTGIGEVKARQLMENFGVTSVQDLIAKYNAGKIRVETNQLTHHIAVGLKFYHDLQLRMSWSEADQIAQRVKYLVHKFDPNLKVEICGSYRRKRETCGDIDVLVSNPTIKDMTLASTTLHKIVSLMEQEELLIGHLTSHGDTKYMGVCRANSTGNGRRIDIRFIAYESMGAAILYFTGSGKFNKLMRFRANQRGYTLNEYGLFHYKNEIKGDQISTPTEQDVFATLRFLYLEPEQREF